MSYDLYVFDIEPGATPADVRALLAEEEQRVVAGEDGGTLTPRLAQLVAELEAMFPGLDDGDDLDASPWSSWPLAEPMCGGRGNAFNIRFSMADVAAVAVIERAQALGLTVYDPQGDEVVPPERRSQKKRRWRQRG